ncbi:MULTISPECIES: hypothetical protein [Sorangium]|uniref:Uncharacterized protein n=1 Tax=Sorangium cellulosum TaxID=56 RepID=A0A4P2QHL4_SORCE|nr:MULTISPECIES: hypothetical protein [Sorangium]AUX29467.1 uncharacterized protein SOCE836_015570 [Sorangium cellulosum]WCQ88863.1 hypothetical protein NQZ70_01545 [Sorangium sp. Soce836]
MKYVLRSLDRFGAPRWERLSRSDAAVLVGYWYGRGAAAERPLERLTCARGMMMTLFCAGAPWDEIAKAADGYVNEALAAPRDAESTIMRAIHLTECMQIQLVFPDDAARRARLIEAGSALLAEQSGTRGVPGHAETLADLKLHLAAVDERREALPALEGLELGCYSLLEPVHRADGAAFAEAIDAIVRGARDRGTRCARPDSALFVQRIQGFEDVGSGFLYGGSRRIGAVFGLRVPEPPPDTLPFYPPDARSG